MSGSTPRASRCAKPASTAITKSNAPASWRARKSSALKSTAPTSAQVLIGQHPLRRARRLRPQGRKATRPSGGDAPTRPCGRRRLGSFQSRQDQSSRCQPRSRQMRASCATSVRPTPAPRRSSRTYRSSRYMPPVPVHVEKFWKKTAMPTTVPSSLTASSASAACLSNSHVVRISGVARTSSAACS